MKTMGLLGSIIAFASIASCAIIVGFEDNQLGAGGTAASSSNGSGGMGGGGAGGSSVMPGDLLWAVQLGEDGDDNAYNVAVDTDGNAFVLGTFQGAIDLGSGPLTGGTYIAKYDPDGNHLWSKAFALGISAGKHLGVDPSSNLFVGNNYPGALDFDGMQLPNGPGLAVAKMREPNGTVQWSKGIAPSTTSQLNHIAAGPDGSVSLAGVLNDVVDFGLGSIGIVGTKTVFLAKADPDGTPLFSLAFEGGTTERADGLTIDKTGNIILVGTFNPTMTIDQITFTSQGGQDIFVAKFDSAGNILWAKPFGSTGFDEPFDVACDDNGNIFIMGEFDGTIDFGNGSPLVTLGTNPDIFLVKLDPNGNQLFGKRIGGAEYQELTTLAVDTTGAMILAGTFAGQLDVDGSTLKSVDDFDFPSGFSDGFLIKLDAAGQMLWNHRLGDPTSVMYAEDDTTDDIALDPQNHIFAVGLFYEQLDLGTIQLQSRGQSDGYLVKYAP